MESFHHKLNQTIELAHPRVSILIDKLIKLSIEYYLTYVEKIFINNMNNNKSINIYKDIWNFLIDFMKKYDRNINIKLLLQDQGKTRNSFEDITNNILTELFNYNISKSNKNNNSDSDKSDNSEGNDIDDLNENWWFSGSNYFKEESLKEINESSGPFEIDAELNFKKKKIHYSIENDIMKYLYNKK